MINFPPSVMQLFDEGRTKIAGIIRFDFGTGTYGFINSDQPFTNGGVVYEPGGILEVSDFASNTGLYAQEFQITLAASEDDDLTPAVLRTIEAEDYRDRPVTISDVHFHPDTGELLHIQPLRRGYVDLIDHDDNPVKDGYRLIAACETRALDYTRSNARKRNTVDQQRRSSGDKFLEHASKRGREEVFWGRLRQGANAINSTVGNLIRR